MNTGITHEATGLWDGMTACGLDAHYNVRWPEGLEKVSCEKCRTLTRAQEREDLNEALLTIVRSINTETLWNCKTPQERAAYIVNYLQTTEQTAREALELVAAAAE